MSKTTRIRYVPWLGTVSREVDTGVSEIETEGLEEESEELGAWVGGGVFFSCLLRRQPLFAGQFAEQNLCLFIACICPIVKLPPRLHRAQSVATFSGARMPANLQRRASLASRFHPPTFFVTIGPLRTLTVLS